MSRTSLTGPHTVPARLLRVIVLLLMTGLLVPAAAQTPAIPQIPAFLPKLDAVPATQAMPLDGTWLINTISKKIRIEGGRAYAVDDWLHLFVLKVEPGMVVIKDITPTAPGEYSGQDLPLMGAWTARVQADRSLSVSVAGAMGPANYRLTPIQLDNPQWYAQEMAAAGLAAPQQTYQPQPPAYQPAPPVQYQPAPPAQAAPPAYQPQQPGYQPAPPAQYQPAPPAQAAPPAYQPQPPAYQPAPAPGAQPGYQQPAAPVLEPQSGSESYLRDRTGQSAAVKPRPCGSKGASPCEGQGKSMIAAIKVGAAKKWGCQGERVYFTPHNGGECWSCPEGYIRGTGPIYKRSSCISIKKILFSDTGKVADSTFVRSVYGCGAGEFHMDKSCYRCPGRSKVISLLGFNPSASCSVEMTCQGDYKVRYLSKAERTRYRTSKAWICL